MKFILRNLCGQMCRNYQQFESVVLEFGNKGYQFNASSESENVQRDQHALNTWLVGVLSEVDQTQTSAEAKVTELQMWAESLCRLEREFQITLWLFLYAKPESATTSAALLGSGAIGGQKRNWTFAKCWENIIHIALLYIRMVQYNILQHTQKKWDGGGSVEVI